MELINDEAYKYDISPIVSGGCKAENFYNLKELKYASSAGFSNVSWLEREGKKSSNEMKTAEFVDLLNQDQEEDVWTRDENINEGYPILKWQMENN